MVQMFRCAALRPAPFFAQCSTVRPCVVPQAKGGLRPSLLAVQLAIVGSVAAGAGWATPAVAQFAGASVQTYNIPAGPLTTALNRFAEQAGILLSAPGEYTQNKRSAGLSGGYTAQQGLAELLRGQGLQAVQGADGTYRLVQATAAPVNMPGSSATTLSAITVAGAGGASSEIPAVYAGGQVATGSRVGMLGNKDFMETPFSTVSYTDSYIKDIQAADLGRVIALTDPSVYVNGATGMLTDSFSVRGFSVSGADVALNGLYGMVPYYRVTPEFAERIEVLKGPSALLNGMPPNGSVGGSVNVVPKRAGEEPIARVTATYASDAQLGTHIDLGQRFGENKQFGIRFNGVYRDGDTAVDHQSKRSRLAALGLDWRSDTVRLSADMYTSEDHTSGLNRGISLAAGQPLPDPPRPETLLAPDWTFGTTKDKAVILRGEVDVGRDTTVYASYGHSKTDFDALASSTYTVFNDAGDFRNNFAHQRFIYDKDSAEAGLTTRFRTGASGHELALTASYYHHDYQFGFLRNMLAQDWITNIYDPVWGPSVGTAFSDASLPKTGEVRMTSYGVADTFSFAQDRIKLTLGLRRQSVVSDTFSADTGARTARYDASATTPAIALLYQATPSLSFYANYIEGLSQGDTAPVTADNAGEVFAPYKTKQREAGVKYDLGSFVTTVSLFQIERPSAYTDPVTNIYSFGGEQRNRGIEWNFFGQASRGLRLMGGVAYLQPKLTKTAGGVNEGMLATATPQWQGKLGVEWDVPQFAGLTLMGNASVMSKQYINADNSIWIPGRTVYDVGARYATRVASHAVTFRATVQNVTNKAYWAGSLASGLGAPRTFLLSATMDF